MALLLPALLLLSAATTVPAAAEDQITWGSVVYVFHGERTPDLSYVGYNLSPLGANQMVEAGSVIRDRYVHPPLNKSEITAQALVNGISEFNIDNSQLSLLGTDEEVSFSTVHCRCLEGFGSLEDGAWKGRTAPDTNSTITFIVLTGSFVVCRTECACIYARPISTTSCLSHDPGDASQ
jgi:hypothetical protein